MAAEAAVTEPEQETATIPPGPEPPETVIAPESSETGAAAQPETSSGETQDEADGSDETETESGVSAPEESDTEEKVMQEGYFSNEQFKDLKIADPFVLKASDGMYYLYGTTGGKGFSCRKSEDLLNWSGSSTCFMAFGSDWCGAGSTAFWAPEVVELEGKYYMFYCARNSEGSMRIGVAACDTPDGMFQNLKNEPLFDNVLSVIDPNVLIDDDGAKYLYFSTASQNTVNGKGCGAIYVVRLEDDFSGIAGEPEEILSPDQPWEMMEDDWYVMEAPEVLKHDGKYYLSYSANHFRNPAYSVGYAVSDSPLGPFVKAEENPILTSIDGESGKCREDVSGTGHHSFTVSPDGTELWVAYHSHVVPSDYRNGRRFNLDRAGFTEGGKLYIDGPTTEPQPVPSGAMEGNR